MYYGLSQALTPLFLEREFGLGTTQRGLLLAVGAAMSSVASALAGLLGARLRPAVIISFSLPLLMAGFVAVGLAPSLWVVGLGVGLIGCGYGFLVPVLMGFATSVGQPRFRGILVGTYVSGNRVGMFAGPALTTVVAGAAGERPTYLMGAGRDGSGGRRPSAGATAGHGTAGSPRRPARLSRLRPARPAAASEGDAVGVGEGGDQVLHAHVEGLGQRPVGAELDQFGAGVDERRVARAGVVGLAGVRRSRRDRRSGRRPCRLHQPPVGGLAASPGRPRNMWAVSMSRW